MPLQATSGAASYDGFGGGPAAVPNYIEDVFATTLFTGNGGTQTITTGVDLSTFGGLVWGKQRLPSNQSAWHELTDTARGFGSTRRLSSNSTNAGMTGDVTGVTTSGVTLGTVSGNLNTQDWQSVLWSFRKQPKFFDVVTYTGNGANNRQISHSLGSAPGFIIVKNVTNSQSWICYHRSLGTGNFIILNGTGASSADANAFTTVTSTFFVPTADQTAFALNTSGDTFVAYLFAHNAGGFGLTGTDNVISCGSFTTNGSALSGQVELGWEPQWLLIKRSSGTGNWMLVDNMRGVTATGNGASGLYANLSNAEDPSRSVNINATGFSVSGDFGTSSTSIYIAIRRGPMKTPTTGTSVFSPTLQAANSTAQTKVYGFVTDSVWALPRNQNGYNNSIWSRLQGPNVFLSTALTSAENTSQTTALIGFDVQDGVRLGADTGSWIQATANWVHYPFRRAPGFFDVVCYTGTGANLTLNHNLGVTPELIITKRRNGATYGAVYASSLGVDQYLELFSSSTGGRSAAQTFSGSWLAPTSTTFGVGVTDQNLSAATYVAYLFSTVAGVSKVGSYTGNGSSQTINCGFTGGARFVLIKRTNAAGDWVVFDSARGIVSGNDPFLELNTTAAEQTGQDAVDTDSTGFVVNETTENLNVNGASYIFLAIA